MTSAPTPADWDARYLEANTPWVLGRTSDPLGALLARTGGALPFGTSANEVRNLFGQRLGIVCLERARDRFVPKDVPQLAATLSLRTSDD